MTDGGHGGQLDHPCMLHMSVDIRGNGKGISECPMNALVMQVQQVADADAVGDFTGCRNIVTHHLGVVVDPQCCNNSQVGFAKAIPGVWGDEFPLIYQVPRAGCQVTTCSSG